MERKNKVKGFCRILPEALFLFLYLPKCILDANFWFITFKIK